MGNKESAGGAGGGAPPPARVAQNRGGGGGQDKIVDAIGGQREAINNLEKKITHLEQQASKERALVKQYLSAKTDKTANMAKAKRHLMKAKRFEAQITKFDGMRDNLERMQGTLETAATTKNTIGAMKAGKDALQAAGAELDPDKIDDLVSDITEQMDEAETATNALSQPIGSDPTLEADAEDELEELRKELEEEELVEEKPKKVKKPAPKIQDHLPEVPSGKVVLDDDEDEELRALQQSMN